MSDIKTTNIWSGHQRDASRIPRLLKKLLTYWEKSDHTDLRLCQIIVNLTNTKRNSDIYYIEDDVIEKYLDEALTNYVEEGYEIWMNKIKKLTSF